MLLFCLSLSQQW